MSLMVRLPVLLLMILFLSTGCLTQTILVRQSLTPIPEEAKGVLYVADSKAILVGVERTEILFKKNMEGYYLIHKDDLQAMVRALRNASAPAR